MKLLAYKKRTWSFLVACMLVMACTHQSCDQREIVGQPDEPGKAALELSRKLPKIRFVDSSTGSARTSGFSEPGSFSFSDDPQGVSFTSSADIRYEEGPDGGVLVVDISSLGGGGGVAYAGSNAYPVDIAFCFSSEDPLGVVDEGDGTGLSGVIGFVGLDNVDLEHVDVEALGDQLEALVYYMAFDDQAEGEYDVTLDENSDPEGMAVIFDLKREVIYVSSKGKLNVSSASMSFEGFYYESGEDSEEQDEVPGFGEVGCS